MSGAESELWRAVIRQAIIDATSPLSRTKSERLDQIRAREWFTKPNRDFAETCRLADMDPDRVRNKARQMIEAAKQHDQQAETHPPAKSLPRKRGGAQLEYQGRSLTITEWAAETGMSYAAIRQRLNLGWSIEAALTTPKRKRVTPPGVVESIAEPLRDRATRVAQDRV